MSIHLSNKPIIYNNKDFHTIQIRVLFPFNEEEKYLPHYQLLPSLLSYIDLKYPTEELFQIEKRKRYILAIGCMKTVIGTSGCFIFDMIVPDTIILKKDILEEQIDFFREMIYHPLIKDDSFLEFEFNREVTNLKIAIKNSLQNLRTYQSIKIRELVDDIGILSRDLSKHIEDLDKVTPKELYSFYKDVILNNQPMIYVMGNTQNTNISNLCQKYLYLDKYMEKDIDTNFYSFLKPRSEVLDYYEKSNFKDSSFTVTYKVKDMNLEDRFYLLLTRDLLSSLSSRLLGKKLRDEEDLIYSSNALCYSHYGVFEITAFISKKDKDKVKEKILEVMDDLRDKKIILPLINNIIERKKIELLRILDDKYYLFDEFIIKDLDFDITKEDYYEFIKNIKFKNYLSFLDRLVLDTFFFLEEGEDE